MSKDIELIKSTFKDYYVNRTFIDGTIRYYYIVAKGFKNMSTDYSTLVKIENGTPKIVSLTSVDNIVQKLNNAEIIEDVTLQLKPFR